MTGGQLSHRVGTAYSPFRLKHSILKLTFKRYETVFAQFAM